MKRLWYSFLRSIGLGTYCPPPPRPLTALQRACMVAMLRDAQEPLLLHRWTDERTMPQNTGKTICFRRYGGPASAQNQTPQQGAP